MDKEEDTDTALFNHYESPARPTFYPRTKKSFQVGSMSFCLDLSLTCTVYFLCPLKCSKIFFQTLSILNGSSLAARTKPFTLDICGTIVVSASSARM